LSQEITAILAAINPESDEVLVRVESAGGAVHSYGYASSQIARLKKAGIRTTVAVDRIAASGGYMMACVADRIISSPFAIVGSIGVVAELPNFNKLITDMGVEYKQYTAGEFKRTISTWAPITEEGETKFIHDLNETYDLFKHHVSTHRPDMDIDSLATGEHWYGTQAFDRGLVDEIKTSDEWILERITEAEVLKVVYMADKPWGERVRGAVVATIEGVFSRMLTMWTHMRFMG
jgi:serine protease SohB